MKQHGNFSALYEFRQASKGLISHVLVRCTAVALRDWVNKLRDSIMPVYMRHSLCHER